MRRGHEAPGGKGNRVIKATMATLAAGGAIAMGCAPCVNMREAKE